MKFAILGSGAVGGYYWARLARAGHDVTFIARGANLVAIRERGLEIRSPALGDDTVVLTVQNGVDSPGEVAAVAGEDRTLGGTTYVATALESPGVIVQTGAHRRIVFGEAFGALPRLTDRVKRIHEALAGSDIQADAVGDGRVPIWEKFVLLAALAGFTGAARLPIGPLWADPVTRARFRAGCREIKAVARAEGVLVAADVVDRIVPYIEALPGSMRSSLPIDLQAGKRIEVEALQESVVRRAATLGVSVPIMSTLYAVLKPHAEGPLSS